MTKQELYLKTIFCCMACDGEIAQEEVAIIREVISKTNTLDGLDVESNLNKYISEVNKIGAIFLNRYLKELANAELTAEEQLIIVGLALQTIEADQHIEYAEVKFFKKIRTRLSINDEMILEKYPDKEDFLLPDICVADDFVMDDIVLTEITL